ncbi:HXXEE domain-containing protein [Bisgaard Taxon 10/6]|uniref:HXXEE domain-containing protein n=1 Tax=Exercitatus varius TaxID=67857 RepID=A0AAW6Q817_9PAST|nr:HXXEE domain-containing protein [Exercitatus varius]QOF67290.1 HXXEE domain-containing protein [Actinobacillus sp. GY-402]MDG2915628.1 HXXEE domain-containing protein [Exercitatus varius]MDG2917911.1 HXXEE domain-containing protein [Exercitatus varius]MDG2942022.1 HXXEE domain-containing protein [Exercitatus varius]MDG2943295.1 HXXEE domain-containing protein [Exercitatus varius]
MDNLFVKFNFAWPWMGLAVAAVLSVLMITTDIFRRDENGHRWADPVWLAWLVVPLCMFHQFEEYAASYNVTTDSYAMIREVCRVHGFAPYEHCPIPIVHFPLVNVLLAWVAAPMAAILCKRNPLVGLSLYGLIFADGLIHLIFSLVDNQPFLHHPGLITGSLLFIPLALWVMFIGVQNGIMNCNAMICTIFAGVIGQLCLYASYSVLLNWGVTAMLVTDVIAVFIPLVLAALVTRRVI